MSYESHLAAVYSAQLRLGEVGALLRGVTELFPALDAALIEAVGTTPGTDPGQRAAENAVLLRDTLSDAIRLCDRMDDLLSEYRKAI